MARSHPNLIMAAYYYQEVFAWRETFSWIKNIYDFFDSPSVLTRSRMLGTVPLYGTEPATTKITDETPVKPINDIIQLNGE
jgi:hypothetical protein